MGEQDNNLGTLGADRIHHLLAHLIADPKTPILNHVARVGERRVRKCLTDHRHRNAVHFPQGIRLKHSARVLIKSGLSLKRGIFCKHHVLRQELNRRELFVDDLTHAINAVGKFPMAGHDVDAKQLTGIHHILTVCPQRRRRALPGIATIHKQTVRSGRTQAFYKRCEMRESAHFAVLTRCSLKIQERKGVRIRRAGRNAEVFQKVITNDMRGFAESLTDADVKVRLAKIHRHQLRMAIREVHQRQIAKGRDIVIHRGIGKRSAVQGHPGRSRHGKQAHKITSV